MKATVNKHTLSQLFLFSTYVLATFPLHTFQLRSITLIAWSILGLLCAYRNNKIEYDKSLNLLLVLILPFLILSISLGYSVVFDYG
jgi:hypothetical protein